MINIIEICADLLHIFTYIILLKTVKTNNNSQGFN